MGRMTDLEKIEQAQALSDIGWSGPRIARHMGISNRTVYRWLSKIQDEEMPELVKLRENRRKDFIDKAWERAERLDLIVKDFIEQGQGGFKNAKEAATVFGIYMDKIVALEARRGHSAPAQMVQIDIHPPEGYIAPRVECDAVSVCDESDEVHGDGSRDRGGEDLLALPEGGEDGC